MKAIACMLYTLQNTILQHLLWFLYYFYILPLTNQKSPWFLARVIFVAER